MKPLRTALAAWEPHAASSGEDPVSIVKADWSAIVGEDVAAHSRPLEIAHDALLIATPSSAWSQQLAFLSETILDSVRARTGLALARVRFRVGRITGLSAATRTRHAGRRVSSGRREPAETLREAFDRFQHDVSSVERAKERAGWKQCTRCGVRIQPSAAALCAPCRNAGMQERGARVARLLFEAPWLGFAGIAPLVSGLSRAEYDAARLGLLRRWKDVLERIRRNRGVRPTARDRMAASSYVLLKSELDPERIVPAVVRDLLGDELHEIFYGSDNN